MWLTGWAFVATDRCRVAVRVGSASCAGAATTAALFDSPRVRGAASCDAADVFGRPRRVAMRIVPHDNRLVAGLYLAPVRALGIPRAVAVVILPVRCEYEADDRNTNRDTVLRHQHALAAIVVLQKGFLHPAAVAASVHVAPRPAVDTAFDGDRVPASSMATLG